MEQSRAKTKGIVGACERSEGSYRVGIARLALAILSAISILGCVEFVDPKKDDQPSGQESVSATKTVSSADLKGFSVTVRSEGAPNDFQVWVTLPPGSWPLRRVSNGGTRTDVLGQFSGTFQDTTVPHLGDVLRYEIVDGMGGGLVAQERVRGAIEVQLPMDLLLDPGSPQFEVKGEREALQLRNLRTLVMAPGTSLVTNDFNVLIRAEKAAIDSAVIRTFEPKTRASADSDGRSGGDVRLEIAELSGSSKLLVEMRGEDGGVITKFRHTEKAGCSDLAKGIAGRAGGNSGRFVLQSPKGMSVEVLHYPGKPGPGGIPYDDGTCGVYTCSDRNDIWITCRRPADHAFGLYQGSPGRQGQVGETCIGTSEKMSCSPGFALSTEAI